MPRFAAALAILISMLSSLACCCPAAFQKPIVINPPPVIVQQPPIDVQPPQQQAPQPRNPPAVAGAPRTFDLIPIIDLNWDVVDGVGKWRIQDNKLYCDEGNFVPRVQVPYIPPEEYDFAVTFSQPALRNGVSLIIPKPAGGSFYWAVGFNGGDGHGFDADRGANFPKLVQPNLTYVATAQIRRDSVKGLLNGKPLTEHRGDLSTLKNDMWRQMKNDRLLGVACDDPCTFHRIQITEIKGTGKAAR